MSEETANGEVTVIPNAVHRKCTGCPENFFEPLNFETGSFFFAVPVSPAAAQRSLSVSDPT